MGTFKEWIKQNPYIAGGVIALLLAGFGICLIIGAIKDWDWLYEPDEHYQNNWTMGQISRYLGRKAARMIGVLGGVFFIVIGLYLSYIAFTCNW